MKRSAVCVALAVGLLSAGLLGVGAPTATAAAANPCAGKAAVDHQAVLANGETPSLVANLVPVKGYCYLDVSADEVAQVLDTLQSINDESGAFVFSAVSVHSIRSARPSENTALGSLGHELGFLSLYAFGPEYAPTVGSEETLARSAIATGDEIGSFTAHDTKVLVFEDRSSRDSRYYLTWVRHGVEGAIDGASRKPMTKWVRAYLAQPVLVGSETSRLSRALVPIRGFAYVNFSADEVTEGWVTGPLGEVPSSQHQVVDSTRPIGGLVLAEVPASTTTADYVAKLQAYGLRDYTATGPATVGTTAVERFSGTDGSVFVWVHDGIAGVGMTAFPDRYLPFLEQFLGAAS